MNFDDSTPLGQAKAWLREEIAGDGAPCPCCRKPMKVYRRGISATVAKALINAYRKHRREPFHTNTLGLPGGDFQKLAYRGFLERESKDRDPDAPGVGIYRITEDGVAFVLGTLRVDSHALVVWDPDRAETVCVGTTPLKGQISIREALGNRFDYDELMGYNDNPFDDDQR